MKLYWAPASPYARKVRAVAIERGLTDRIEDIVVNAFEDPAALLAVNPLGKLPVLLIDDGDALYDSPVICAMLDNHPDATGDPLVPAAGPERWRVLRGEALADGIMDLAFQLAMERRKPEGETSPTFARRWRTQLDRALDALAVSAPRFPGCPHLDQIATAVALGYLDFRHGDLNWRDGRRPLADWHERISMRESLAATKPA